MRVIELIEKLCELNPDMKVVGLEGPEEELILEVFEKDTGSGNREKVLAIC